MAISMDNGMLHFKAATDGLSYDGSASLMGMVLWFTGPPLALWLLWFITRNRPESAPVMTSPDALHAGAAQYGAPPRTPSPLPIRDHDDRVS
jgi:hypothetical protein